MKEVIVLVFETGKVSVTTETPMVLALRDLLYEADWDLLLKDLDSIPTIKEESEKLRKLEAFLGVPLSFSSLGPFLISEFKSFIDEEIDLAHLSHVSLNGLYDEALNYADLKLYDQAVETVRFMLKIDPRYAPAYELWGSVLMEKGETEKAAEMLKKAVEIDPYLVSAYAMLGDHFYNLGKYEEAAHCWEKEIKIAPDHKFTYFMIADAYEKMGKLEKAIDILERLLKVDEKSILAMYEIAELYKTMEERQKAESYESKIIASFPHYNNDVEIWAKVMFKRGRYEEVERFIEEATKKGYLSKNFELLLVVPYLKNGKVEKARELIKRYKDSDSWLYYGKHRVICEALTEEEKAACGLTR
ncbi:MAG: tetratricopeptide repeat protein [Thermotogae bacterium]|nr:tetratricopeptide repeat protein [Thermotogota bacterium]